MATRWPAFISATAICSAVVDLPEPPFSLPNTTTCADWGELRIAWSNMTHSDLSPRPIDSHRIAIAVVECLVGLLWNVQRMDDLRWQAS